MKMNDQPGNIVTQFFVWLATIVAGLGLATQDVVYMAFGLIGVFISLTSYVNSRIDVRRRRKEDEKQTQMLSNFLDEVKDKPHSERSAAVQVAVSALEKVGE